MILEKVIGGIIKPHQHQVGHRKASVKCKDVYSLLILVAIITSGKKPIKFGQSRAYRSYVGPDQVSPEQFLKLTGSILNQIT